MKRIAGVFAIFALLSLAPLLMAQEEHGEVGVFADMTRLGHLNNANFWGVGGQLAFNLNNHVQLEGGMAYDFERSFTNEVGTPTGPANSLTFQRTGLRLLNGLFGPKIQTGIGPVKAFVVLKGGFLNFSTSGPAVASGFNNSIGGVTGGDTNGVFYPGGGIELFAGRIGFRAEVGDLMYFDRGANHNLRIGVGPQFRF